MQEEDFAKRLSALRQEKGASARDMSLSLGQNAVCFFLCDAARK